MTKSTVVLNNDNKIDMKSSRFVALYFLIEALNMTIKQIFPISEKLWGLISNFFLASLAIVLLFSIRPVLKRTLKSFIIVEMLFAILFLFSFLQGNASEALLLKNAFNSMAVAIPIAFYVVSIRDKEILYNTLLKTSYYLIIISGLVFIKNIDRSNYYTMSTSYTMLMPSLLQLNEFFNKKRFKNFIFFLISFLGMLLFGARGPLLGIVMYLALKYLLVKLTFKKVLLFFIGLTILIIFITNIDAFQVWLLRSMQNYGVHSRTLNSFVSGSIMQTSGRNLLWEYYFDLINQKPLIGWGVFGGWIGEGSGPHNMLVEYLLAFGYAIGGILCVLSIGLMFRVFFVKDKLLQQLILLFCSRNIGLFFVSGGFLGSKHWLIFIALCLISFKAKNNKVVSDF